MSLENRTTIKEIAAEAGVSIMTVSRVFNHPEKVKTNTRMRVNEALKRLGYTPNTVAQALSNGRTNIIYVYIPTDIVGTNPFYLNVLAGIADRLGDKNYSVLMRKEWYSGEACDGIILMGLNEDDTQRALDLSSRKQVVVFGSLEGADSIDIDNRLGMKMMGKYLIKAHKKHILYLSIDAPRSFVGERESGFKDAVEGKASYQIAKTKNDTASAHMFMEEHFDWVKGFDAVCCATDEIALGVVNSLREHGVKVGEEIAVTGFDGLGREMLTLPAITTIHQPIFEVGQVLADRLMQKVKEGVQINERRLIAPSLYVNGTVL